MKKTFPGSADSGKVPVKIFTIAVGTVYNRGRYRMGPTATIIEIGTIAGRNFISYPLAICIKKSAKREYTISPPPTVFLLFADFCTELDVGSKLPNT
jgi:hypothetical protein